MYKINITNDTIQNAKYDFNITPEDLKKKSLFLYLHGKEYTLTLSKDLQDNLPFDVLFKYKPKALFMSHKLLMNYKICTAVAAVYGLDLNIIGGYIYDGRSSDIAVAFSGKVNIIYD